jgi:hypothetical protein
LNLNEKKWKKPELIVLVRGNLEENVLAVCKVAPDNACPYGGCRTQMRCDAIGSS